MIIAKHQPQLCKCRLRKETFHFDAELHKVYAVPDGIRLLPGNLPGQFRLLAPFRFSPFGQYSLINFMDGLDLMTVAEAVPITVAVALLGSYGHIGAAPALVAAALCGALLGFAPFNRPVAKIFLGDVGSLPIGLLLGWCLLELALHQQFAAALLLPLYYLTDATVTLFRRMARREPFLRPQMYRYPSESR